MPDGVLKFEDLGFLRPRRDPGLASVLVSDHRSTFAILDVDDLNLLKDSYKYRICAIVALTALLKYSSPSSLIFMPSHTASSFICSM